jgi:hypothetical protein
VSKALILPQHEAALTEANESNRRELVGQVIRMLEEDRRLAYKKGQAAVALSASRSIAELMGILRNTPPIAAAEIVIDGGPMQIEGNRDLARRIAMTLAVAGLKPDALAE